MDALSTCPGTRNRLLFAATPDLYREDAVLSSPRHPAAARPRGDRLPVPPALRLRVRALRRFASRAAAVGPGHEAACHLTRRARGRRHESDAAAGG